MFPLLQVASFFCIIIQNGFCDKNTMKIGAIFGNEEKAKETAFNLAIAELNANSDLKFQAAIQHIQPEDPLSAMIAACSLLEEGVAGILGPTKEHSYKIVQSICDEKDIPLVVTISDDQPITSVISLHPYQKTLIKAYMDIIDNWGYEEFAILYENNEGLKRLEELISYYYSKRPKVVARELDRSNTLNYRPVLKEMLKAGVTHFVVDCSIEVLSEVLRQAQQVSLMSEKYHFFITNLDWHTLELAPYQYSETNITGIRFIDPDSEAVRNMPTEYFGSENDFFGLMSAYNVRLETLLIRDTILMLGQAIEQELPKEFEMVPVTCESNERWVYGSTIINSIQNMRFPGATGLVKFDITGHRSNIFLDVIELKEGGITIVGNWSYLDGLNVTRIDLETPKPDNKSLSHESFKVLISLIEPFAVYKSSLQSLSGNDQFEGYAIDLIRELSLLEGFNYTFLVQENGDNGGLNKTTKQWSGMMGEIINERVDLAIADLTITSERQEYVDFAAPFMTLGISILYHKPTKAPPGFFSFAEPFALEVWELLAAAFFGVSILFFFLGRICSSEWSNPYPCVEEPEFLVNQLSLRNCFWFTAGSLMQQGSDIGPVAISTRLVGGVWWFFTLIMVSSYTANLTTFLTKQTPQPHFKDVYELVANAEKYNIKYGAKRIGSTVNFFRDKKNIEAYQTIYNTMQENAHDVLVQNPIDGVIRAEKENYAFFMESTSIEYEIQRRCNLTAIGDLLDEKSYGIAMKKNSTYRSVFNRAILKLQRDGKLADLKRKWWEERRGGGLCSGDGESSGAVALGWQNVSGVFWVTIAGTVSACVLVVIELILHVIKESIKNKTSVREALVGELKFYFKFSGTVKPVVLTTSTAEDSSESLDAVPNGEPNI